MAPFQARDWAAAFQSQPGEFEYWIQEVEGTIPDFLSGTLFRNGPGNFGAQASLIRMPCCYTCSVNLLYHYRQASPRLTQSLLESPVMCVQEKPSLKCV